ncbi:MAG: HAMP domain-containing histidine kinase [Bacteroidetes bacterium]|nr:HAMP domain-containing histidine kinase [Bacteroidota bacterium]
MMKLLTRFSLINLLVMVLIFFVSSLVIYELFQAILIKEMDGDLGGIEKKVKNYIAQYHSLPEGYPLDEEKISFEPTGQQIVDSSSNTVLLYSEREKKMHNFRQRIFPLKLNNIWYRVAVAKPIEGIHHLSRAIIRISLVTILVTILVVVLLNSIMLRRLWKPFYASLGIMRNFKLGRTASLNFPSTKVEEFAFMNESLLLATQKAEQDYLLLKEFTENASHEMQTPLSIIRSKLDVLIQEKGLSEKQGELAKGAYAAIRRMSRLNHSLLLLAKIENHQYAHTEEIALKEKLEEKINQFQELWQSHRISTSFSIQETNIHINPELMEALLNNLFSNASNHNIAGGSILIELQANRLSIGNTGHSGALDEKRLFTRFYKESINSNSNGLGLSIIKQIAKVSSITIDYRFQNNLHSFILSW